MGLFEQFPYTNFHDLNLDWILRLMKEFEGVIGGLDEAIAKEVEKQLDDKDLEEMILDALTKYGIVINVKAPPANLTPASGNGTSDDTIAIQGCIDYASSEGYGVVFFPSGAYLTRSLTLKNKTVLAGLDRYNTRLVLLGGSLSDMLTGSADELTISGIGIDGNSDIQVNNVNVLNVNVGSAIIENCEFTDGFELAKIDVARDLQLSNVIFNRSVRKSLVISGNGKTVASNIICKSLSTLLGSNFIDVDSNNCIISDVLLEGSSPIGIVLNGNNNNITLSALNSVTPIIDNGIKNNYTVMGVEMKESYSQDVVISADNYTETLTGNKVVSGDDYNETFIGNKNSSAVNYIETLTGDKTVSAGNYTETLTGNKVVSGDDYNETFIGNKNSSAVNYIETLTGDKTVSAGNYIEFLNGDKNLHATSYNETVTERKNIDTKGVRVNSEIASSNIIDSLRVNRKIVSGTVDGSQTCGIITEVDLEKDATNNHAGMFSIVHSRAEDNSGEFVGLYSQISNIEGATNTAFGMVSEVKDIWQDNLYPKAINDRTLVGMEIDVCTSFPFSTKHPKFGLTLYPYGGGCAGEAIRIGENNRPNGTYASGEWRHGIHIMDNAVDPVNGFGLWIASKCPQQIALTGVDVTQVIGIHTAGTCGINIDGNLQVPIAIAPDKTLRLNSLANTDGIQYDTAGEAVTMVGKHIGVEMHEVATTANPGGGQATPATVTGYLTVMVNGFLKKIPYYNI